MFIAEPYDLHKFKLMSDYVFMSLLGVSGLAFEFEISLHFCCLKH